MNDGQGPAAAAGIGEPLRGGGAVAEVPLGRIRDVGVLETEALPTIRIVPAGEYYDYHAKYVAEDTQYICPGLSGSAESEMRALAFEAFRTAACSGWGRVDIMRDRGGANYLLEVNTAPGMTSHSLVPKAARALGIEFDELVWRVLETSFAKNGAGGVSP